MPSNGQMQPPSNDTVRSSMTKLQNALENLPGSACLASVFLPGSDSFDGLAGGDPNVLPLVIEDAIWRTYQFYLVDSGQETAQKILLNALEKVLGYKVLLGESLVGRDE